MVTTLFVSMEFSALMDAITLGNSHVEPRC